MDNVLNTANVSSLAVAFSDTAVAAPLTLLQTPLYCESNILLIKLVFTDECLQSYF